MIRWTKPVSDQLKNRCNTWCLPCVCKWVYTCILPTDKEHISPNQSPGETIRFLGHGLDAMYWAMALLSMRWDETFSTDRLFQMVDYGLSPNEPINWIFASTQYPESSFVIYQNRNLTSIRVSAIKDKRSTERMSRLQGLKRQGTREKGTKDSSCIRNLEGFLEGHSQDLLIIYKLLGW